MKKLTKTTLAKLAKTELTVKPGDLAQALAYLRNSQTMGEIEYILSEVLDEATFNKVTAVFKAAIIG